MQHRDYTLGVFIDKLTNSIERAATGERLETDVVQLTSTDQRQIKKKDVGFDWKTELQQADRTVYKLVLRDDANLIQGLLSVTDNRDHVFVNIIESAKHNRGKQKLYVGVAGNLFAFACHLSKELGYDGFVCFDAKTALIKHYEQSLGAKVLFGYRMVIETPAAERLINQYFNS